MTYASASRAQCTSTAELHGATAKCRRSPNRAASGHRSVEAQLPTHRGVQPVRGGEVPRGVRPGGHPGAVLGDLAHGVLVDRDAGGVDPVPERPLQDGATDAASAPGAGEDGADRPRPLDVADAGDLTPGRVDAEFGERVDGAGHQSFAARLVQPVPVPVVAAVQDDDVEPGAGGVQRGREARGPGADDEEVRHATAGAADSSARFSARIRTVSRAALSTVNTTAVIHAVRTSGSAIPSRTTAT